MSAKGRVVRWLGRLLLADATVAEVRDPSPDFRLVRLTVSEAVRAALEPGDKIQVLLPADDVRTFTPFRLDGDDRIAILGHVRTAGSASAWLRSLAAGDAVRFSGPGRSLRLPPGPVVLVGDETSIAVTASYARARPGAVRPVFELGAGVDATAALAAVGLADAAVFRRPGSDPALLDTVVTAAAGASIGITGGGELVQRVRAGVRARGFPSVTVKAYWVEGKTGLD